VAVTGWRRHRARRVSGRHTIHGQPTLAHYGEHCDKENVQGAAAAAAAAAASPCKPKKASVTQMGERERGLVASVATRPLRTRPCLPSDLLHEIRHLKVRSVDQWEALRALECKLENTAIMLENKDVDIALHLFQHDMSGDTMAGAFQTLRLLHSSVMTELACMRTKMTRCEELCGRVAGVLDMLDVAAMQKQHRAFLESLLSPRTPDEVLFGV